MKKFKGLNYVELTLAMVIIGIITVIGLQIMRPGKKTFDPLFMGVWDNLMKANEEIIYANEQNGSNGLPTDSTAYCERLGEEFSIKSQHCGESNVTHLQLTNGVNFRCVAGAEGDYMFVRATFDRKSDDEAIIQAGFLVNKIDGMVIPLEGCNNSNDCSYAGCVVSGTTDHYKFRVISKETGEIVQETREGVSFQDAVCYMGVNSKYNITCKNGVNKDSNICPYPASCRVDMIMPKLKGFM